MSRTIHEGDCVKIPDGRIARVREISAGLCRVRVRRASSNTHQFLFFRTRELERVDCPKGWMSPVGYNHYLRVTLSRMRDRLSSKKPKSPTQDTSPGEAAAKRPRRTESD